MTNPTNTEAELRDEIEQVAKILSKYHDTEPHKYLEAGEVVKFYKAHTAKAVEEAEKAYGGCHKCYGKGWASHQVANKVGHKAITIEEMKFCTCGRGKQLEEWIAKSQEED